MLCRWFISFLFLLVNPLKSNAQDDPFKVITADPWAEKVLSVIATPNVGEDPSTMCQTLLNSEAFGGASLQCGSSRTDASLFSMTLDAKVLQASGSDAECIKELSKALKRILTLNGEPRLETRSAIAPLKYEATFSKDPIFGLPNGCVKWQEKTMKVTNLGVMSRLRDFQSEILDSVAPVVTVLANMTSNAKFFEAEYHLQLEKSEAFHVFFNFYEEQETQEFRRLWKFLSTMIRTGLKYETRIIFVPKITERTELCRVTERKIPVIALTLNLIYPRFENERLLKLGGQDKQAYNATLEEVYNDLTKIMRQSSLATAVWSFSLDALEQQGAHLIAWIYITLDLNKMPSDFSGTALHSNPLKSYITGKMQSVTGVTTEVHRAVLTHSRIGCTYMGRKLTPETSTPVG